MDRRAFLTVLAAGTLAALTACDGGPLNVGSPRLRNADGDTAEPTHVVDAVVASTLPSALAPTPRRIDVPPPAMGPPVAGTAHTLTQLPGTTGQKRLALTIDDGTSSEVVSAYVDFVISSGIRLTFFPNGINPSWTDVKAKLAPLVESGQVQLGNHTWDHPSVTSLSDDDIAWELSRNEKFLNNTYGVDGRPYFRPPFGFHDDRTDRVTGELGYTRTVMWWGSLGDSSVLEPTQIVDLATTWFQPERIVIGHANHPAVTHTYPHLLDLINERRLQTVTLREVYGDGVLN